MALCSHGQYEEDSGYPEQNPPDYLRPEQIYIKISIHMALNIITLNELKEQSQILPTHQATQPDNSSIRQLHQAVP
jgi:hypothetical protein